MRLILMILSCVLGSVPNQIPFISICIKSYVCMFKHITIVNMQLKSYIFSFAFHRSSSAAHQQIPIESTMKSTSRRNKHLNDDDNIRWKGAFKCAFLLHIWSNSILIEMFSVLMLMEKNKKAKQPHVIHATIKRLQYNASQHNTSDQPINYHWIRVLYSAKNTDHQFGAITYKHLCISRLQNNKKSKCINLLILHLHLHLRTRVQCTQKMYTHEKCETSSFVLVNFLRFIEYFQKCFGVFIVA